MTLARASGRTGELVRAPEAGVSACELRRTSLSGTEVHSERRMISQEPVVDY